MEYLKLDWNQITEQCRRLAKKLDYKPDLLVGVSRGGLPVVRIFSDLLDIEDVDVLRVRYYSGIGERGKEPLIKIGLSRDVSNKKVLVVDDVADTGESLKEVKRYILEKGAREVRILTLMKKPWSAVMPEYYDSETERWIIFPWEIRETILKFKEKGQEELKKAGLFEDYKELF